MDPLIAGIAKNTKKRESFWGRIDWEGAVDAVLEGAVQGLAFYNQTQAGMDVLEMDDAGSARLSYDPLQQGFELAVEPGLLNPSLNEIPGWQTVIADHPGVENQSQTLVAKLEARQGKQIPVVEKPRQNQAPRWDQVFRQPAFQENRSGQAAVGRGVFGEQTQAKRPNYESLSPRPSSNHNTAFQNRLQQQRWENQQHLQYAQQPRSYAQLAQAPTVQPHALSLTQRWFPRPANRFQQAVQETLNSRSPEQLTTRALRQSVHELELAAHQKDQAFSLEDFETLKEELVLGLAEKALEKLSKNQAGRYQMGSHDLLEPEAFELELANVREQLETGKPLEPWQQEQVIRQVKTNPKSLSNQVKSREYYAQHPEQILVDRPEAGNLKVSAELTHLSYLITEKIKELDIEPSDKPVTRPELQALLPAGSVFKHKGAFRFPSGVSGSIFEAPDHVVVTIDGTNQAKEWATDLLVPLDHYSDKRSLDTQKIMREASRTNKPIVLAAHSLGRLDADIGARRFIKNNSQWEDKIVLVSFDGLRNDRLLDDFGVQAIPLKNYDLATRQGPVSRILKEGQLYIIEGSQTDFFNSQHTSRFARIARPFYYPQALQYNHSLNHYRNYIAPDLNVADLETGRLEASERGGLGPITPAAEVLSTIMDGFN